jgi:hypothetical protein
VNAQPSDVHRPFDGVGAGGFGALAQRGSEVNCNRRDERDGERTGKCHHDGANDAPRPPGQRMVADVEELAEIQNSKFEMQNAFKIGVSF